MPRKVATSGKAERDKLRDHMHSLGCSIPQIAIEMARRFNLRPRAAWRHALGWTQWKLAQEYNTLHPGAKLADNRVSEYESWPQGGTQPDAHYLATLATTFGHGCTPALLIDAVDMEHFTPADRYLLVPTTASALGPQSTNTLNPTEVASVNARDHNTMCSSRRQLDAIGNRNTRRVVRCDERGLPIREEIIMAAEESAQFRRWSATTNVDDDVIAHMESDIADIAACYLTDPPASVFTRLINARDDVFALISGRQAPRHTLDLYKIGGQMCALLAHASADLGHAHAANSHARAALHCADITGYTPLRVYTRWVQSNVAYWDDNYDTAAELIESALPDATSGTALLRLSSQQARIHAARGDSSAVARALATAATAATEPASGESGVFAFATGKAAYYASEAHRELGGKEHLEAAVNWAMTAVEEFTAERRPNPQFIAAARIDLARAYLAQGDLDAVGEQLRPVITTTIAEQRTVPVISRARSLKTLLAKRPDAASAAVLSLRDDLAEFCISTATAPTGLDTDG